MQGDCLKRIEAEVAPGEKTLDTPRLKVAGYPIANVFPSLRCFLCLLKHEMRSLYRKAGEIKQPSKHRVAALLGPRGVWAKESTYSVDGEQTQGKCVVTYIA